MTDRLIGPGNTDYGRNAARDAKIAEAAGALRATVTAPATPTATVTALDVLARALDARDDNAWGALVVINALYEAVESLATHYADQDHSAAGLATRLDALYEAWSDCDEWRPDAGGDQ